MKDTLELPELSLLVPVAVWRDGKHEHRDENSGKLIPESLMQEYNQYYGLSGYDDITEHDDEQVDCAG